MDDTITADHRDSDVTHARMCHSVGWGVEKDSRTAEFSGIRPVSGGKPDKIPIIIADRWYGSGTPSGNL